MNFLVDFNSQTDFTILRGSDISFFCSENLVIRRLFKVIFDGKDVGIFLIVDWVLLSALEHRQRVDMRKNHFVVHVKFERRLILEPDKFDAGSLLLFMMVFFAFFERKVQDDVVNILVVRFFPDRVAIKVKFERVGLVANDVFVGDKTACMVRLGTI